MIHETAIVDKGSRVSSTANVWHFCHISEGASIGNETSLGQNVFVGRGVKIGIHCKIQNNVSIYEGVTIEDVVFLGPSCVFTNVKYPPSDREGKKKYEKTLVKFGAVIGANATIVCGVTIGSMAFVGAGAVVTEDVPSNTMVVGVPAKVVGKKEGTESWEMWSERN